MIPRRLGQGKSFALALALTVSTAGLAYAQAGTITVAAGEASSANIAPGARFTVPVIVDMTARVKNDAEWDLGLSPEACEARSIAIREDFESFALTAGQAIFAQPVAAEHRQLADWASLQFARNDAGAIAAVWASLIRQDVRALLEKIQHPTLIVHGGRSELYGDNTASHLVAALPHARAVRFENSGHAPHLEEPALFNNTLKDFADRLSLARTHQD